MTNKLNNNHIKENIAEKPTENTPTKTEEENVVESNTIRWVQLRLFPIWLRIILVLILLFGAGIVGVMFGYGVIGDGKPIDALKTDTWQHIFDIMNGKE